MRYQEIEMSCCNPVAGVVVVITVVVVIAK
jgi:hypothetical protein